MSERIQNVHPKEYKGVMYKSTLEAETAEALDCMGLPIRYEERRLTVLEGFRCPFQKDKVRAVYYKPDFTLGNIIIECKGFETPEYLLKKKLIFKYLMENEPGTCFFQIHDTRKDLLKALDHQWQYLGYAIRVTSKKRKKNEAPFTKLYDSVDEALADLKIKSRALGSIMRSLTGKTEYVFGYNWKLEKLSI